jgi:hypothetical protein
MVQNENAFAGMEYDPATGTFVSRTPRRAPRPSAEVPSLVPRDEEPGVEPRRPASPVEAAAPKPRHDGWTRLRQRLFLEELADCGIVTHAAARAGMTRQSAWRLRRRSEGTPFAQQWDEALEPKRRGREAR